MKQFIYGIVLQRTGDTYVGITTNVFNRWRWHLNYLRRDLHVNKSLQAAWNKYGQDAFQWRVFEVLIAAGKDFSHARETHWIRRYGTFNARVLLDDIGSEFTGLEVDDLFETIEQTLRSVPELSDLYRRHQNALDHVGLSPAGRASRSSKMLARYADPAARLEQSLRMKAFWVAPEKRLRRSKLMKRVFNTPAMKLQNSERSKKNWADPIIRARLLESRKHRWDDPELRRIQSERQKAAWVRRKSAECAKTIAPAEKK